MVSAQNLLLEILQVVLSKLESKDLSQCQRVCKNWKTPAQHLCCEKVRLRSDKQQELFFQALYESRSSGLGKLVKSVFLNNFDPFEKINKRSILYTLFALCPNLVGVDGGKKPTRDFWLRLLQIFNDDQEKAILKGISRWLHMSDFMHYSAVALKLRSTLKQIEIVDGQDWGAEVKS